MRSWLSWVLLLIHILLLAFGGVGLWVASVNYGQFYEWGPPSPPPRTTTTTTTTTTTQAPEYNRYRYREEPKNVPYEETEEYREYLNKMRLYADLVNEPRIYMAIPCGLLVVTSSLSLIVGIISGKSFTTTSNLYTSIIVWAIVLVSTLAYQLNFWKGQQFPPTSVWTTAIQSGSLIIIAIQVILSMWDLRRQKASWPALHITKLFTVDMIVLVCRLTVAVFMTITMFDYYSLTNGLRPLYDSDSRWDTLPYRYPLWLAVSSLIATFYSIVVPAEIILSTLTGTINKHLTWITTLLSGVGSTWMAVLMSPAFIQAYIGQYYIILPISMILAIILSVIAFLHTLGYWFLPGFLHTPPRFIRLVSERLSEVTLQDPFGPLTLLTGDIKKGAEQLAKKMPKYNPVTYHFFSLVVNTSLIMILAVTWDSPMWRAWGAAVLMGANVGGMMCSLPPVIIHFYLAQPIKVESFAERAIRTVIEGIIVFIGAVATMSLSYEGGLIAAAVINLIYLFVKVVFIMQEHHQCKSDQSDKPSKLIEEEEEEEEEEKKKEEEKETLVHSQDPVCMA